MNTDGTRLLVVFPEDVVGGAEIALLRIIPGLIERGWTVQTWAPTTGRIGAAARAAGADVSGRMRPVRYSLRGFREPPGLLRRLVALPAYMAGFVRFVRANNPDVVHVNTAYGLPEAILARLAGARVILHVHDILPARKSLIVRLTAALAVHAVVACSHAAARPFRRNPRPRRCYVVHNGVPFPRSSALARLPVVVGTTAAIRRGKGIDVFLAAARLVAAEQPGVQFVVLGRRSTVAEPEYVRQVERMAAELSGRVSMRESPDAVAEMAAWTIFVLASRQDAFPLAVLEALSLGLPVVASNVGGIPEQIRNGTTGVLVPANDPQALASEIARLLRDESSRQQLGAFARSEAARWSLDKQCAAMDQIYRRLVYGRH